MSKRSLIIAGLFSIVIGVGSAFAWQLWLIDGAFRPIQWTTEDGGLTMTHMPGKGIAVLHVTSNYTTGQERHWKMTDPGATNRIIGAPSIPSPEALFRKASITIGDSDTLALCRFYEDATRTHRQDIKADLRNSIDDSEDVRALLAQLLESGDYPWLAQLLGI